ncbi:hypothetical protein [Sphingosinicella rhizophila]|uniref:Uncharacterized protein n=1 Tax=Sphingosinicella rhizophila TaxID=3050082 RepID=A0ABU3QBY0_9SPHN|nr:hypothetical protein [Sphingosinicella sp. GR2756]MDT9600782.1 hypothetical protein [Sphingosinicella sp. GR2756]
MKRALPWLAPLAALPFLLAGLWLWQDQGMAIWLSGILAACF